MARGKEAGDTVDTEEVDMEEVDMVEEEEGEGEDLEDLRLERHPLCWNLVDANDIANDPIDIYLK
ncbi:uncharacterized protein LOC133842478 isoform X5 [Drosophila sulfurigaster albostrigata]|uniref:uncharacterized protein LOC133842478 isoform X5 n=1 Tax=Drosophila sulfurigaster albostrigata TaxID=89887 RepID=UPI002D21D456|nr:uncharacterized protein LOC133842478 isoform X5 [Drosophila sulfurigaster albostrigata]